MATSLESMPFTKNRECPPALDKRNVEAVWVDLPAQSPPGRAFDCPSIAIEALDNGHPAWLTRTPPGLPLVWAEASGTNHSAKSGRSGLLDKEPHLVGIRAVQETAQGNPDGDG